MAAERRDRPPGAAVVPLASLEAHLAELSQELTHITRDVEAQIRQERDLLLSDFETQRIQLHTEYSQRLLEADQELQGILSDRAALREMPCDARKNDVVSINVGGRLFTVKRETLHVCSGSFLAELFSGRWESQLQKDAQGHPFLDIDPDVFEPMLTWLRDRKIETPDRPAAAPAVSAEDTRHFQVVADYLGLLHHLGLPELQRRDGWSASCNDSKQDLGSTAGAAGAEGQHPAGLLQAAAGSFLATLRGAAAAAAGGAGGLQDAGAATADAVPDLAATAGDAATAGPVPKTPGWSIRFAHPAIQRGDKVGGDVAVAAIPDTRVQGTAAAVRGTRGYRTGRHYWEVEALTMLDRSFVGFVSPGWVVVTTPVGRSADSWGVASCGTVFAAGEELGRLPVGFSEGSRLGFLAELDGGERRRTVSVCIDGTRYDNVFTDLPETLYPAVSNFCAEASFRLEVAAAPPPLPADGVEAAQDWFAQPALTLRSAGGSVFRE